MQYKKLRGFRRARSALHRHRRRPKPVSVRNVRRSVEQDSQPRVLRTIYPNREKLRDLRRAARSAQRPHLYDLFDIYHPEYKDYDRSYRSEDWIIYRNAQDNWVQHITGDRRGCYYSWGGIPATYRRDRNRQLRTRQKAVLHKALREEDWDDFSLPRGRRDIAWLYW